MSSRNTKYIRISSLDKDPSQSTSNGDFIVDLKEKYLTQSIKSVMIYQAWVPNVFYNIRSTQGVINNQLLLTETTQLQVLATIPEGQYTIADFITALQTSINAVLVGSVVTITQDPITKRLTFTFVGNSVSFSGLSAMAQVMGFVDTIPASNSINMPYIPNLRGYDALYIHSNTICPGNMIDGNAGLISALASINMGSTPFGGLSYYQETVESNVINYTQNVNMSTIRVILRDSEGNRLDPGTSNIELIMRVVI